MKNQKPTKTEIQGYQIRRLLGKKRGIMESRKSALDPRVRSFYDSLLKGINEKIVKEKAALAYMQQETLKHKPFAGLKG